RRASVRSLVPDLERALTETRCEIGVLDERFPLLPERVLPEGCDGGAVAFRTGVDVPVQPASDPGVVAVGRPLQAPPNPLGAVRELFQGPQLLRAGGVARPDPAALQALLVALLAVQLVRRLEPLVHLGHAGRLFPAGHFQQLALEALDGDRRP